MLRYKPYAAALIRCITIRDELLPNVLRDCYGVEVSREFMGGLVREVASFYGARGSPASRKMPPCVVSGSFFDLYRLPGKSV